MWGWIVLIIVIGLVLLLVWKPTVDMLRCINVVARFRVNLFQRPYKKFVEEEGNGTPAVDKISYIKSSFAKEFPKMGKNGEIDTIVIGSGVSGMTTGILLSQAGQKVVVLECNEQAGGLIAPFYEEGYEFNVGLHEMYSQGKGDLIRVITDRITDKNLRVVGTNVLLNVILNDCVSKKFEFVQGYDTLFKKWTTEYVEFQSEEAKKELKEFLELCKECSPDESLKLFHTRVFPLWFGKIFLKFYPRHKKLSRVTIFDVMKKLAPENEVFRRIVFSWEAMHNIPIRKCAAIWHGTMIDNVVNPGMWHPIGGSRQVVKVLCNNLKQYGGKVFVNAPVKRVLCNKKGAAIGVVLENGDKIYSKRVVSSAGVHNSYRKLLPKSIQLKYNTEKLLEGITNGWSLFVILLGFDTGKEKLDLGARHRPLCTHFVEPNIEKSLKDWDEMKELPSKGEIRPPVCCVAFNIPDNDPNWDMVGKFSAQIFFRIKYDWFNKWNDLPVKNRGNEYKELKRRLSDFPVKMLYKAFPSLEKYTQYVNSGSPLSFVHYNKKYEGSGFGVQMDCEQLLLKEVNEVQTPIKNYFLSSTDIAGPCYGHPGASIAGFLAAGKILGRMLLYDALNESERQMKEIKKKSKKEN